MYVDNPLVSVASHFAANLKHIKEVSISWAIKKKAVETKDLIEIELLIAASFNSISFGFSSESDKSTIFVLEYCRRKIL